MKYKFLGKYYEFDHIGVETFDLYKKTNGKLVKKCIEGSPYLTKKSHFYDYINILESRGYKSLGLFMDENEAELAKLHAYKALAMAINQ